MSTSFAQSQFGKPIDQITAEDLKTYFLTEHDESLTLEFKSFYQREGDIKHKENGVLRTICGFLNSNGGLLVWGAPIGSKNSDGQKVFTGSLSPVEKRYSKDDFIRILSGRIVPFAAPVQVEAVEVESGKFIYLIDVPESQSKPHQFDNIYYMRLDGQTKAAPHYIIDALFKQIKLPELNVFIRLDSFQNLDNQVGYRSFNIVFTTFLINSSKFLHEYDPYYMVLSNFGGFLSEKSMKIKDTLHIYDIPSIKALTYNIPLVRREILHMPIDTYYNWCDKNIPLSITIAGGGRLSPPKRSAYEIRLVNASKNKGLVLSEHIEINRIMTLEPISLNQFNHDEWSGSEQDRLNQIVNFAQAK